MLGRRKDTLPKDVRDALGLGRREQAIAWARDDTTEAYVVATTFRIVAVRGDGTVTTDRPWHLVDAGHWDADTWTLTASWVDGARAAQWTFKEGENRMPETFRERVQATVVAVEPLALPGPRRAGRVVLRKDLAAQEVFVQEVLGRGTPADDPEVRARVAQLREFLQEQAGL
ncbi:hypothetical protein FB554_1673 [Barrientosiimonas humi]|uniref:Uncharacterized protein n=2 Tax=Barrientosiimonas TaxID=1535207 RepID=A0A542XCF6_9MICO|nr:MULTISPECIES: hypothetical protein [Barrientosiimonas]TQL33523.1 hypothetical protein FB554_1673 [Barrientosiimonas humi]BDZ58439.1 hypothetical protein GCM10025872_20960 [Barrientosiimonas endolithica]CAG7573511.1 hypothetical protein BH39T_PBIAJDOK_02147 [Barrientosiimonas humi]